MLITNNIYDLGNTVNTIQSISIPLIQSCLAAIACHVGEYKWSARSEDFGCWLVCDGRSLSRIEYASLFEVIGTEFGAVDADSFNLPDLRGRVMGCVGNGQGLTSRALGDMVGAETHVLSSNEMPNHNHTGTTGASGTHNHGGASGNAGGHTHNITDPGHAHTQTTTNDDFNSSGTNPPGFAADSAGSMTWNNINPSTTGITINSVGDHAHSIASDGSHTHTFSTSSVGGGQGHNNMQPTTFAGRVFIYCGIVVN